MNKITVAAIFIHIFSFKLVLTNLLSVNFDGSMTTKITSLLGPLLTEHYDAILKFMDNHLSKDFVKIINNERELTKISETIIREFKSPRAIITATNRLHEPKIFKNTSAYHKFHDYLFFPDNLQQIIRIITFAYNQDDWAPRRRFLNVITCNWGDGSVLDGLLFFKKLLAYNVVFIKSCKGNLTGYTWALKKTKTKKCVKDISLVKFDLNQNGFNPFSGKYQKKINGCSLKIGWFFGNIRLTNETKILGYPYYVLKEFARTVDATIILNKENKAYRANIINNLTIDVLVNDMENNKVDIAAGYTLISQASPYLERTLPIRCRLNYWLIPQRQSIVSTYLYFRDVSVFLWLTFLFMSISVLFVTRFYMTPYLYEIISKWPFTLTCVVFGIGIGLGHFRNRLISFRLLLFSAIVFGFYMSLGFYTITNSVFTNPPLESKITNFRQLVDSRFKLRLFKGYAGTFVKYYDNRTGEKILAKWIRPKNTVILNETRDFSNSKEQAIFTNDRMLEIIKNYKEIEKIPAEPYAGIYEVFTVRSGFPLLNRMNDVLHRIQESGFISKWISLEMSSFSKIEVPLELHRTAVPLTLSNMKGAFVLLGAGLFLSTIIFILEIIFHKR